jgi:hypothetical protein
MLKSLTVSESVTLLLFLRCGVEITLLCSHVSKTVKEYEVNFEEFKHISALQDDTVT